MPISKKSLEHIRSCPRCEDSNIFRPGSVSAMEIDFGDLKARRSRSGVRAAESPLFFYSLALCEHCRGWFFLNFRVDADRFLQSYQEHCPTLYERDELAIETFFGKLEGPLEGFALPDSIRLSHIKELG